MEFHENATVALDRGASPDEIIALTVKEDIGRMKYIPEAEFDEEIKKIKDEIVKQTSEV
jgi:V/A-type H+-transporting ATPase subunit A